MLKADLFRELTNKREDKYRRKYKNKPSRKLWGGDSKTDNSWVKMAQYSDLLVPLMKPFKWGALKSMENETFSRSTEWFKITEDRVKLKGKMIMIEQYQLPCNQK